MAAAALPMWLALQAGTRALRAFSTSVSPATHAPRPAPQRTSRNERLQKRKALPPRTEKMVVDQDWPSVYPVAAPFKPSAVPLPVRMGYPVKKGVPMAKEGNLELLKIPNFLHLTPVAIKRHCEALKDFCTEWPVALDSDKKCEKHFPIEIDTTDYVSSGPSIRNPKARVVILRAGLIDRKAPTVGGNPRVYPTTFKELQIMPFEETEL
ncbi:28S ribosomal protein S35, mitochondrial isoform X1 [Carlito syrichta]|uniref:28S ribosomal protein S35, mitochondrial isoform X1 n=1 Tax=Carlito syrichta TaxID=1868482 RepID=A0A3Q0DY66_CARSF|nr:28S ribosomal protein S35, mitochondrial isoform X1 [Carlito syrichta]